LVYRLWSGDQVLRSWRTVLLVAMAAVLSTAPALSVFLTGSQWLSMNASDQTTYVAGVYDALVSFVGSAEEARTASHYQNCVARSKMSPRQMSENIKAFVAGRPEFHAKPMAVAVGSYLFDVCGKPPSG
jgi:hypothetical protein